ncbi:hypothetical protein IJH24_03455 [Candidatus Saccharibacteria bacterium]|nr:hypothetical protein [Candidatus Saccharibacteria bacterium]
MYFEDFKKIPEISKKTNCVIFVLPKELEVTIPRALVLRPEEKSVITVEQVRGILSKVSTKQLSDQFIVIRPAEKLSEVATNAFLKNLEEPNDKIHYVLITDSPSKLLPTVLSRARIYFLRKKEEDGVVGTEKDKNLAKRLMVAKPKDLILIAEEISKKKSGARAEALKIIGLTIEMLYKSYFITEKDVFIKKLPKFLKLYESLEQNGHIKLHFVADLC